jgi:hypothetical protein
MRNFTLAILALVTLGLSACSSYNCCNCNACPPPPRKHALVCIGYCPIDVSATASAAASAASASNSESNSVSAPPASDGSSNAPAPAASPASKDASPDVSSTGQDQATAHASARTYDDWPK